MGTRATIAYFVVPGRTYRHGCKCRYRFNFKRKLIRSLYLRLVVPGEAYSSGQRHKILEYHKEIESMIRTWYLVRAC